EVDACADGGCDADACADGGCDAAVDAPAPRCGDGNTDPGEACDDGNAINGDGCQNNCTRSQCTLPIQCSDGLFCNGIEVCRAGTCAAGTPPVLDDGVACTVDSCNEGADRIDHTPNDTLCSSLTTVPRCATSGAHTGRLTRQIGVCQARGCAAVEQLVDDCLDDTRYPTSYLCAATPSRILRRDGVCLSSPSPRCGYADTVQTQCSTAIPSPHPYCSGTAAANNLTHHYNAVATCSGTPAACGYTESTTACRPGSPTCSAGRLTTYTPTCSGSGCSRQANTATACPAGAPACATVTGRPIRRTYAATCNTAGTACASPGTPTDTPCPTSGATCGGTPATRTTYTATCSGAGVCGQTATPVPCPDQASVCQTSPASGIVTLTSYTPACSGAACGTPVASTPRVCSGRLACVGSTLQRYSPLCVASTDYCGPASTPSSTENCALANSVTCVPVDRSHDDLVTVTGACSTTNGCTRSTATAPCPLGNECVDASRVRTHAGCRNATSCQSSVRVCNEFSCFGGTQLWQENGCSGNFCTSAFLRNCDQRRCLPNGDAEQETGCLGSACTTTIIPGGCQIIN
ncbi:MAG TPA: hypothetical protein VI072_24890, partial [Polyangiaceae bacterium]